MEWIKIEDHLPKEGQMVIYYFKETGVARGNYTQEAFGGGIMEVFYGDDGWLTDDVTHWQPDEGQPLPESPPLSERGGGGENERDKV